MTTTIAISEAVALRQVRRLPGFAKLDNAVQSELVNALWRSADDEPHAKRATDLLVSRAHFCPTPADIHDACNETRISAADDAWKPNLDPCPDCGGSGWRIIERGGYSGAQRCPCGDGRAKGAA